MRAFVVKVRQPERSAGLAEARARCEQCGSREWVMIRDVRVCARCGALWPVPGRRVMPLRPARAVGEPAEVLAARAPVTWPPSR
jgi:hypothetical protein